MDWNWLLIVILLVLAGYAVYGYRRGLLRVLFSLCSMILTILFVSWAVPYIRQVIQENTQIYQKLEAECEKRVQEKMQGQMEEEEEKQQELFEQYGMQFPETSQDLIFQKAREGADTVLESTGAYRVAAENIAQILVDGISFFLALLVCGVLLHVLKNFLDIVSRIPVIKGVNQLLGLGAGFLQGLLIVWLFFYFVAICRLLPFGRELYQYIEGNAFLKLLYDNNWLIYLISIFL